MFLLIRHIYVKRIRFHIDGDKNIWIPVRESLVFMAVVLIDYCSYRFFSMLLVSLFFVSLIGLIFSTSFNFAYGVFFGHNKVLTSSFSASNPQVAGYGNNVYVVWSENSSKGNSDIIFRKSADKGATFDTAENLSTNAGNSTDPLITAFRNNVYVVWTDDTTGNADINFKASHDYGNNFNRTKNLSRNNGSSVSPQLAVTGNNVYVVWTDDTRGNSDISFKASHDYGNNFSRTKPISRNNGSSVSPQLAATGNNVYVVWTDDTSGNADINFRASYDYGNNFNRTKNLSRNNGSSVSPQLAATGNYVYVVWTNDTTGNADIIFRKSYDHGNDFEGRKNLSDNLTRSFDSMIAALDKEKIHIIWTVRTNNDSEIFFTASGDSGEHFDNALNLSRTTSVSDSLYMTAYDQDLYLVWVEENSTGGDGQILFKRLSEVFFPRNAE